MAKKTARETKDEASAAATQQANEAAKGNALTMKATEEQPVRPEDGLYLSNGQPVMTDDDKQYTLGMLNDLEGKQSPEDTTELDSLRGQLEESNNALASMESDRDQWKARAQAAETRLDNIKADMPKDSMGLPRVVPVDAT